MSKYYCASCGHEAEEEHLGLCPKCSRDSLVVK